MTTPGLYLDVQQGTPEWLQARCGLPTASRAADIIAMLKSGKGERSERRDYRAEVICEILTGNPYPRRVTPEMQWGIDHEADARVAYELQCGVLVDTCGFVLHPEVDRFGASPDGLVGDDGQIQIKCPTSATHLEYWRSGVVPIEHMPQMLAEMSCTGRDWCDFVSYDPRMPEHLQLFVKRFERNDQHIAILEKEVRHFNAEIDQVLAGLPGKPQAIAEVLEWPNADETDF
jgi:hypothetical protein